MARLGLLDRAVLPEGWYAVPTAPFEILLDVQTVDADQPAANVHSSARS